MKRLTLIRHAKSDWSDATLNDFDRPLNNRGKKAAPLMGSRLAGRSDCPEQIISSPAKRARKTAQLIARELGMEKDDIIYCEEIFEARSKTLIKLLGDLKEPEHLALVGHNPGLTDLGQWLCAQAPDWLPTCGMLTLDLDIDEWSEVDRECATLVDYDYPKKAVFD